MNDLAKCILVGIPIIVGWLAWDMLFGLTLWPQEWNIFGTIHILSFQEVILINMLAALAINTSIRMAYGRLWSWKRSKRRYI